MKYSLGNEVDHDLRSVQFGSHYFLLDSMVLCLCLALHRASSKSEKNTYVKYLTEAMNG